MNHNSAQSWDTLWALEGKQSWRGTVMQPVYERIEALLPRNASVIDVGGGIGLFAQKLIECGHKVEVWDISPEAIRQARADGIPGRVVDLERACPDIPPNHFVVATEVVEHLSELARRRLLQTILKSGARSFISVPNDRLGPDEEPQHTIKFTAPSLRRHLSDLRPRVEVLGPPGEPHLDPAFLLAVCGEPIRKTRLSLTLPVRDEAKDLGRVLASFRGCADEIVVGIDPRTKDDTRAVAERYADKIIDLFDPEGPVPGKAYTGPRCKAMAAANEARVPEGGVHFAWVRNQCLDACTGDWVFMTEGHERLVEGGDALLRLESMPAAAKIAMVWRSDLHHQRWGFPWLHRNDPHILYERGTHNSLTFPDGYMVVQLPEVRTLHERDHHRSVERAAQRRVQNRIHLMDDWMRRGSEFSKYYLASEWREFDPKRSEEHFRTLLAMKSRNGPMRYQARLILAKLLAARQDTDGAREVLLGCATDDWSRTEHWVWLGDLAVERGAWEEALQFYLYGAARIGRPPFTSWWIDMAFYTYLPAQRLAMAYAELSDRESSLRWARVVREQLPSDAPEALHTEAEENIQLLEGHGHDDAAA